MEPFGSVELFRSPEWVVHAVVVTGTVKGAQAF